MNIKIISKPKNENIEIQNNVKIRKAENESKI